MGIPHFGQTGWRARVGHGFDDRSVAYVANALGKTWASAFEGSCVLVGYDTRRDSERMAHLAAQVIAAHGLTAILSDHVCSTPALGWSVAHDPSCVGGVMLTAGSMPYSYGGIVARRGDGGPISTAFAAEVDQLMTTKPIDERGEVTRVDLTSPYHDALVMEVDRALVSSAGLKIVVDTMYGTECGFAQELFRQMGCEVISLHDKPVPDFRGLHPDTREPWVDECERAVVAHHADAGVVFDGDATHFALIDAEGRLVSPHFLAPLALEHIVRQRGRRGRVVATLATSARIANQAWRLGCDFTTTAVGSEAIYREFYDRDVILATDETGTLCVPAHMPERDALMGALMIFELMAGTGDGIRELIDQCERELGSMEYAARDIRVDFGSIQRLRNILPGVNPGDVAGMEPIRISHADGLRAELPDRSWILVRCSRTRPLVRIAAEAPSTQRARELVDWCIDLVRS